MKIIAVIVTYNRKALLLECINAILNQTQNVDNIVIIDNNSTDGTYDFLLENKIICKDTIKYIKLDKNIGGSGGFYEGIKEANNEKADWIWIMDDDTIPNNTALEELVKSIEFLNSNNEKISYLASSVYGTNGEFMNVPKIDERLSKNGNTDWYRYLDKGIVEVTESTFVSLLINNAAVEQYGLPCKSFFIWGDDAEYTNRLTNYFGNAFMVGKSKVIHKRKDARPLNILYESNYNRIKMFYYFVRNRLLYQKKYYGRLRVIRSILGFNRLKIRILFSKEKFKFKKIITIDKGVFGYFLTNINIDDYINKKI